MKNVFLTAAAGVSIFAHALTGIDTVAFGKYAGDDSYAEKSVFVGSGSGVGFDTNWIISERLGDNAFSSEGMNGCKKSVYVGAAAAYNADQHYENVGIGYRAFRNSERLRNCVGIGAGAFSDTYDISFSTWINGQFFASPESFWIKADPTKEPIIEYSNGVLKFNAKTYSKGGSMGGGANYGYNNSDSEKRAREWGWNGTYDLYVDASGGNDFNSGTSSTNALFSLDRAYELATNGMTIAVAAGEYDSPHLIGSRDPSYKVVHFHSLGGANQTRLNLGGVRGLHGVASNNYITLCRFVGFDVVNPINATTNYLKGSYFSFPSGWSDFYSGNGTFLKTSIFGICFIDCTLNNMTLQSSYSGGVFGYCVLDGCKVENLTVQMYDFKVADGYFVFTGGEVVDSVVKFKTFNLPTTPSPLTTTPLFDALPLLFRTAVSNSYIRGDKVHSIIYSRNTIDDSTIVIDDIKRYFSNSDSYVTNAVYESDHSYDRWFKNSLFAWGENSVVSENQITRLGECGSIVNPLAYDEMIELIDNDGVVQSPAPYRIRKYGRGSDAFKAQVKEWVDIIREELGLEQPQPMMLMSAPMATQAQPQQNIRRGILVRQIIEGEE